MYAYSREYRGPIHATFISPAWRGYSTERFRDIKDGLSNTLLVGEASLRSQDGFRTFWAYSYAYYTMSAASPARETLLGDFDACVGTNWEIACKRGWGSGHSGILNFVSCDGAVHAINVSIDLALFGNLATIDGGEPAQVP